ncbi:GD19517 [Drosophila simulans]|uniref:GD19517 n=1 Tax=Drosophila simulans TaxID=7240 RepID=B4QYX8_DROSI|nr:GD19517 [Drosophila simulans]
MLLGSIPHPGMASHMCSSLYTANWREEASPKFYECLQQRCNLFGLRLAETFIMA